VREVDLDGFAAGSHDGRLGRGPQHGLHVVEHLGQFGRLRGAEPLGQRRRAGRHERRANLGDVLDHVRLMRHPLDPVAHAAAVRAAERGNLFRDLGDPPVDVAARPDQQQRPTHGDHVAVADDPHLDVLAVHPRAIGALEIGEDDLVVVLLQLQVVPADPLVVELDGVPLLAADRDGHREMIEDTAPVGAVENAEGDGSHGVSKSSSRRAPPLAKPKAG
jgi:hypothetical protein